MDQSRRQTFLEATLNSMICRFKETLSDTVENPQQIGRELFDLLIAPIEPDITGADTLIVAPDRSLSYIPFAALRSPNYYLVEKYPVANLIDEQFPIPVQESSAVAKAVGLGVSQSIAGFEALPRAEDEVRSVVAAVEAKPVSAIGEQIKLNAAFNKSAFERALVFRRGERGVVHIASHFELSDRPDSSFLLLGTGQTVSLSEIALNPVRYSFKSVELLTLSACETASTSSASGGRSVRGLAPLAAIQGGRSIIGTLWRVKDSSTAEFFKRLYEVRFGQSAPPLTQALAATQREFIRRGLSGATSGSARDFSHPYYWAPFIILGGW